MAITNKDRLTRAMDAVSEGLAPFVERELKAAWGERWDERLDQTRPKPVSRDREGKVSWDANTILNTLIHNWREVFNNSLGHAERNYSGELLDVRNRLWAHGNQPISSEDTIRALDTAERLLSACDAAETAEQLRNLRVEAQRSVYAEEARSRTRRQTLTLEGKPRSGLKPWREIVIPHRDVASGSYVQAEFAADLAQVHRGEGSDEYRDPVEFFRRTYLTQGLRALLRTAVERLSGKGGDPVVELQTNFGGGKTHSMLALYHLFGTTNATNLPGVDALLSEVGVSDLPASRRAVLVGTNLSPSQPHEKPDGTVTRTLWGEMAWQLGGAEGYAEVAQSDESGVSPGAGVLSELFKAYAPCLILIDEWVAFLRQLYHKHEEPAGTFESNMTFVQALTEAARAVPGALLVASLPASQIEIGGEGGKQALERLTNTFGRIESSWQPATAHESFEIVRRRLFEPIAEKDDFAERDAVIKAFIDMYKAGGTEFPQGVGEGEYRRRMEAAYPIHPELFDRLYSDWGSLDKFQRTRGVLRLMAKAIHVLWERSDGGLLILPASMPLDHTAIEAELMNYVDQSWHAVIAKDVDGEGSVPLAIDQEFPTLGRYSATRRVARTVFMGSAPTYQSNNPGIDDRRIRLGCAQPGESASTFGDALRRLVDQATYLYQDGTRYWFSTQPSIARVADDRAADYDEAEIDAAIAEWLGPARKTRGDFAGVHVAPERSEEVPDEMESRLVILGPQYPYDKGGDGRAKQAAEEILTNKGSGPRLYRNMLVFLAPDQRRLSELRDGMRLYKAWSAIVQEEKNGQLNLETFQRGQARSKQEEYAKTIESRIHETWIWSLVPYQSEGTAPGIEWDTRRLQGQGEALPVKVSKLLARHEQLLTRFGPHRVKLALDNYDLWGGETHINTRQLWEYLASYLYLQRLKNEEVLRKAIEAAISELICEYFAYAGRYDAEKDRYEGLKLTGGGEVVIDAHSVLVKPDIATAQAEADADAASAAGRETGKATPGVSEPASRGAPSPGAPVDDTPVLPRRFFGTVEINPDRAARDMGKVAEEVLQHLTALPKVNATITVEIAIEAPEGVSEDIQRVVTENAQTLRFKSHGFEKE